MWIIIAILVLVIFLLIKFMIAKDKQSLKILNEGGMRKKYIHLIKSLMADPRTKVINETSDSILIGLSNLGGSTNFNLIQTFGNITVLWKVDSPVFGKHKIEWEFPENFDQGEIIKKIETDISNYQRKLFS